MAAGSRLPDAPPASLEVVRRKAMVAVHTMERETDVFLDRCTAPLGEADNWLRFAQRSIIIVSSVVVSSFLLCHVRHVLPLSDINVYS